MCLISKSLGKRKSDMNEEEMFVVDITYLAWKIIKYTEINLVKVSNHA